MSTGMSRIDVSLVRRHLGQRIGDVEQLFPLDHAGHGLGAHGAADDVVDVGRRHAPFLALLRIDAELEVRRPADVEDAHVGDALDALAECSWPWSASSSNWSRSGPKILSELSPLTPDSASITLSRMFCEKFQVDAGNARDSARRPSRRPVSRFVRARFGPQIQRRQPVCGISLGQSFCCRKRHEVLAAVETLRVGAVVGPAALRHDRLDLRDSWP